MEWSHDLVLQLVDEYEKQPLLWDAKHQFHFSRDKKIDAWNVVACNLELDVSTVKQKLNSLLGSFRREKSKGKRGVKTEKGHREIYKSKWFAFDKMKFLLHRHEPLNTIHTVNLKPEEEDTDNEVSIHQSPKKKKILNNTDDSRLEEAFLIRKESVESQPLTDNFTVYGQYIANKLRTYSKTTQTEVEHAFNNILYDADKGLYDLPTTDPLS